jgi:hypothetical protein
MRYVDMVFTIWYQNEGRFECYNDSHGALHGGRIKNEEREKIRQKLH